jgi:hypothetical protein
MKTNSFPEINRIPDLLKTRRRRAETESHHGRLQGGKTDLQKKKIKKFIDIKLQIYELNN